MRFNANGFIFYEGPSQIDGAPVVAIATGIVNGSTNLKTGNMIQTWILRADLEPHHATKTGADRAVCGDCTHRPKNSGTCYVQVFNAPLSIFRSFEGGGYPRLSAKEAARVVGTRPVRLGAYGDPAAIPFEAWGWAAKARQLTGYTHQWATCDQRFRSLVMASCDSVSDFVFAQSLGFRTFRIRASADAPLLHKEMVCPASPEGGERADCATCGACDGHRSGRTPNVAIVVHGTARHLANYKRHVLPQVA